ncbi:MAG TPA: hypothetical protein VKA60_24845 [Blastocatellia bacterium]|nr:hypothetical protein [Blastocatellia bacterium]
MAKQRRTRWMVVSTVVLAVAPKCPFCLMAFFGAVGSAAAAAPFYRAWLAPLTAVWLALTVGVLALPLSGRRYGPVLLGLLAGLAVFGGKFILDSQALVYVGIAALIGAAAWRAWRPAPAATEGCAPCERQPLMQRKEDYG